jgi:urocanate hydratase
MQANRLSLSLPSLEQLHSDFSLPNSELVTGAVGGIGLATEKAFALAGASVVVADHDEKLVNESAEKL